MHEIFGLIEPSSFGSCKMIFKKRINPQFNRAGNLKGVAGFKKQIKIYPYKTRSKSPTSSNFSFNRLSTTNVKFLTTRRAPVNSIRWVFDDQLPAKR